MTPVPQGYRQGLITAITVMIAFSLAFIRFWTFEASGTWSIASFVAAVTLGVALVGTAAVYAGEL